MAPALLLFTVASSALLTPLARGPQQQPCIRSALPAVNARLRGGARASAAVANSDSTPRPELALQPTAFIFVLSVAVVTLTPPAYLVTHMGAVKATKLLTTVASFSALMEILLAPLVGALSDAVGRKPVLLLTLASVLVVNTVAAFAPIVPFILLSAFVSKLVVGLFFLSSGASLGDAYRTNPARLAAASGALFALVNGGFAVGIAVSRWLPAQDTLRWAYALSAAFAGIATAVGAFAVRETMTASERVPFTLRTFNPISCVRLLRSGTEMRLLAILLAITLQPIFMGDVIQLYAIGEWSLSKEQLATFFTLIPVLGALGNVVGGRCVKALGVRLFTAIATLSNMLFWAGCCVSHKAALICAGIGFLGPARTLGASTALTTIGASKGIPQGQLSGDRSNPIAILKVIGPAVYGSLYVRGKASGMTTLPFVLNVFLTFVALVLAPFALARIPGEEEKKAS